jgi:predicted GH43/DUF377 family glycosyl hydrolase
VGRIGVWFAVLSWIVVGCTPSAAVPTPTATAEPMQPTVMPTAAPTAMEPTPTVQERVARFTLAVPGPVVTHGPQGTYDGRFTDPGAVGYIDGAFNMFPNGFASWPAEVGVGHAVSDDGLSWDREGDQPVFTQAGVDFAGLTLLASSLLKVGEQYVLYFYTWESQYSAASSRIGRATASALDGPWTADPEPVLEPGPEGAWDAYTVLAPSVVETDDGYTLFYTGGASSSSSTWQIGMATSPDGVHWTKYNDPSTTDGPLAESDPVFSPAASPDAWDHAFVHQPRVQITPDGWVMLYRSGAGQLGKLGLALSQDGVHWSRFDGNPVLEPTVVTGGKAIWYTDLLYEDGVYYLYFELGNGSETNVYVATYQGALVAP